MFKYLALIALLLIPVHAQAQTTVAPGESVRMAWDYVPDPAKPVQFRLYYDGVLAKTFLASELTLTGTGSVTVTTNVGVLPPATDAQVGTHLLEIAAFATNGGESARVSVTITVARPAPTPPAPVTNLRILKGGA